MYGNNFSFAQVKAIIAKEKEKDNRHTFEEWREKEKRQKRIQPKSENEVIIRLKPSTIKKLKTLGRGWKSELSAKVEEWIKQEIL